VAEGDSAKDGACQCQGAASTKPALLQPFKVVVVGTEEGLEATNAAVRAAVKALPHSLVLEYQNNAVEPFVGSIKVLSTVESMVALKARFTQPARLHHGRRDGLIAQRQVWLMSTWAI
jgi:hypothetical protein